jgi:hypothetical protein
VFVSANSHPAYVRRAFQLGAVGFVDKRAIVAGLPFAIEAALDRRTFVSPTLLSIGGTVQNITLRPGLNFGDHLVHLLESHYSVFQHYSRHQAS